MDNYFEEQISSINNRCFSLIIKTSRGKPNLLETNDGKEYVNKIFNELLNNHNIEGYSRNTAPGAVFAERFKKAIRNLFKKPVFEKRNADWLSELPSVIKKHNNTTHSSIKKTPIQARNQKLEKMKREISLFQSSRPKS